MKKREGNEFIPSLFCETKKKANTKKKVKINIKRKGLKRFFYPPFFHDSLFSGFLSNTSLGGR